MNFNQKIFSVFLLPKIVQIELQILQLQIMWFNLTMYRFVVDNIRYTRIA